MAEFFGGLAGFFVYAGFRELGTSNWSALAFGSAVLFFLMSLDLILRWYARVLNRVLKKMTDRLVVAIKKTKGEG